MFETKGRGLYTGNFERYFGMVLHQVLEALGFAAEELQGDVECIELLITKSEPADLYALEQE